MKNWNDYKKHVKKIDPVGNRVIEDIEEQARIIAEMCQNPFQEAVILVDTSLRI